MRYRISLSSIDIFAGVLASVLQHCDDEHPGVFLDRDTAAVQGFVEAANNTPNPHACPDFLTMPLTEQSLKQGVWAALCETSGCQGISDMLIAPCDLVQHNHAVTAMYDMEHDPFVQCAMLQLQHRGAPRQWITWYIAADKQGVMMPLERRASHREGVLQVQVFK